MKIVLCGSMSSSKQMVKIKTELENLDHVAVLPRHAEIYASGERKMEGSAESTQNKIDGDLIRGYFEEIKNADAVLAVNIDKNGIKNYVGGNTFLEMGFAHVLGKKIFLLNPIPDMPYTDEILAMQPVVLNGDLTQIR